MLCSNAKKTNAAFRKLELSTAEDDEKGKPKKVTKLTKPGSAAEALKFAFRAGKPSRAERITDTIGQGKFLYYRYVDYFKNIPSSLDDMIDGLIYIYLLTRKS